MTNIKAGKDIYKRVKLGDEIYSDDGKKLTGIRRNGELTIALNRKIITHNKKDGVVIIEGIFNPFEDKKPSRLVLSFKEFNAIKKM